MTILRTRDKSRPLRDSAAYIASAYVSNNHVSPQEVGHLIARIHAVLHGLQSPSEMPDLKPEIEAPSPQAIRNSVQKDYITSFINGRRYKSMKRHLTSHGLDPHAYRTRYGLPADYPMIAPSYAARRSEIARGIQLGGISRKAA